jgi:uncharacterized protein (TIGR03000 family)
MSGKRFPTRLFLSAIAALLLAQPATAGDWFWYPQVMWHMPWDYPNGHWPSYYLYSTNTDYYGYYVVHSPMGGESTYTVTPADIALLRDPRRGLVEIRVPDIYAEITVDGRHMFREGPRRRYVSPPLEAGERYVYEVKATWYDDNEKEVRQTRKVRIRAGERVVVDFTRPEVEKIPPPK